jgi:predicted O-methyltransferase YrrM
MSPTKPMNPNPATLTELFNDAYVFGPGDFRDHMHTLTLLAAQCLHITEFGTSCGISTSALMFAQPQRLITYDIRRHERVAVLERLAAAKGIAFEFRQQSTAALLDIEETDLLFIDTWHVACQLEKELKHAARVRRYIVMHDTVTFGTRPESGNEQGLLSALVPFLKVTKGHWRLSVHYPHNNGLTVLHRVESCS